MSPQPRLLLVYLGDSLPAYAVANIRYLRRTFPAIEVWLACDSDAVAKKAERAGAQVWIFRPDTQLRAEVSRAVGLDPAFRAGFWINTLLRLWAVAGFLDSHPDAPVVHIEADVWLSPELEIPQLCEIGTDLGYPLVHADEGAASVLVVRHAASLRTLLQSAIAPSSAPGITDMRLLGMWQQSPQVRVLPTSPSAGACFHDQVSPELRTRMSLAIPSLRGIVDAATWGQYLLGLDARNARGRRALFVDLPHHAIDCRNVSFSLTSEGGVNLHGEFGVCALLALHVHSKDIRMFTDHRRLLARRVRQAARGARTEWDVRALLYAIVQAALRRLRWVTDAFAR